MGKWVMLGAYARDDCLLIVSQASASDRTNDVDLT